MTDMKVAVLGLGIMGGGMATQLIARGFDVTVWNRDRRKAEPLAAAGARVVTSPAEAAQNAQFVVTMLANDEASRSVWLGDDGALPAMKAGTVAIECSTLTVDWVRELACEAIKREVGFLDAPVTGSKAQAAGGTLRFLVGGDAATFASAEPVLSAMGSEAIALGPVGSGAVLKLINNFLCGVQVATLAEALVMIERSGLDLQRAADILVDGAPGSPLLKALAQRMITADYAPHFHPPLMAKDLAYAIAAFAGEGIDLVTAAAARQRFEAAAPTYAEADIAAIIEPIRIARG